MSGELYCLVRSAWIASGTGIKQLFVRDRTDCDGQLRQLLEVPPLQVRQEAWQERQLLLLDSQY